MKNIIEEEILKFLKEYYNSSILTMRDVVNHAFDKLGIKDKGVNSLTGKAVAHKILSAFKIEGNQGVVDIFKDITGVDLEPISKGKFIYKK